jgi:hypothetical protein
MASPDKFLSRDRRTQCRNSAINGTEESDGSPSDDTDEHQDRAQGVEMITIAGGIVLGFSALWVLDLTLGALLISFLTPGGQTFWLIAIGGLVGLALLASLPGWFIATIAIGGLAFAMMRKHAPNWTPWRDSKGESVFGGRPSSRPSPGGSHFAGLDLRPIKTDRKGRRL